MRLSTNSPLQNVQRAAIAIEAKKAYEIHLRSGLIDHSMTADEFRRVECWKAAKVEGASKAKQSHYATLMGHFLSLQGRAAEAFKYHLRAGRETEVDAPQTAWHLTKAAASLGKALAKKKRCGAMTPELAGRAYLLGIARDKLRRPNLTWEGLITSDADTMTRMTFEANTQRKKILAKPGHE